VIVPAAGDFRLDGEADTERLGMALARVLRAGEAVCLAGPLGVGKSVLARALVRAFTGETGDVPSPTFTLVQFYAGERGALAHFDLYRLEKAEEAFELGLDEALDQGAAVIEWPERLGHHVPRDRLDIVLQLGEDGVSRHARLTPHGAWEDRPIDLS
jgi:tRNA threonylcarbamoyladenosine biosynthesis protein TsaE